jgi:two-component system sensor histidine kinase DctS
MQNLQALHAPPGHAAWAAEKPKLLRNHREWLRMEWRGPPGARMLFAETPYRACVCAFGRAKRAVRYRAGLRLCARISAPAYCAQLLCAAMPRPGRGGDGAVPALRWWRAKLTGYLVATYSLQEILSTSGPKQLTRSQEVSFTEADGTRLALHGMRRGAAAVCFTAQQLLDLPGNTWCCALTAGAARPTCSPMC